MFLDIYQIYNLKSLLIFLKGKEYSSIKGLGKATKKVLLAFFETE